MPDDLELPPPVFIGFFPKHVVLSAETIKAPGVEYICSVSNCISQAPDGWIDRWLHNELGFYNDETTARSIIGAADGFELFAYTTYPIEWNEDGGFDSWDPKPAPGVVPGDYELLGYDAVSKSFSSDFECSPLSCNAGFDDFKVNEHCLFPDLATAREAMPRIASGNYEPGTYYLIGVYRKRS